MYYAFKSLETGKPPFKSRRDYGELAALAQREANRTGRAIFIKDGRGHTVSTIGPRK